MRKVTVERFESDDAGVFGNLKTASGFACYTLERPVKGDHPCIPAGTYSVERKSKAEHPQRGPCYEIMKVKDRTDILIHSANWSSELLGCLSLGRSICDVAHKDGTKSKGVTSSRDAVAAFEADLEREPFELTISWAEGVEH